MRLALVGCSLGDSKLSLGECDSLIDLTGIGKLAGVHQLDAMIVRQGLGRFGSNGGRFFPLMRSRGRRRPRLIAALDVFAAKGDQLLVGRDGLGGLVLLRGR